MAEIFAVDDDTVVKLDRPEFNGVALHEATILREVAQSGLPVPHVIDTVVTDGRHGVVMERLRGSPLSDVIRSSDRVEEPAEAFVELHVALHSAVAPSAPDLVPRLAAEIERSELSGPVRAELVGWLVDWAGEAGLCHFDLHPENIMVTAAGWRVIDWIAAATGPCVADFARTVLLGMHTRDRHAVAFMDHVRRYGMRRRGISGDELDTWLRIVAAGRLSEGFAGDYASWLRAIALG
jgi:tRNA A-37 threonylcarbamoyl transferase component Bud32